MPRQKRPAESVTRGEALVFLSTHMRNPEIAPNVLAKLVSMYTKVAGWKSTPEPDDETNIDQLVAAEERNRKFKTQLGGS